MVIRFMLGLVIGIAGAYIGMEVCQEVSYAWWAGAITSMAIYIVHGL